MQVPAFTTPLVKFIRTTEGILAVVFGVLLTAIPIISSNLPPALADSVNAGKWLVIATVVARTGLKAIALLKGAGMDPIPFQGAKDVNMVLQEIETALGAIKEFQGKEGTPADQIVVGLSPTPKESV